MIKRFKKLFGTYAVGKILITAYRSYGTTHHLYLKGRVLDNIPLEIMPKHSLWQTIKNSFLQFDTHEVSDVRIQFTIGSADLYAASDRKGYFLIDTTLPESISDLTDAEGWVTYKLRPLPIIPGEDDPMYSGEFLIPEKTADYGIISDIDDTILTTGVTSFLKWELLRNSLFVNAYRRTPLVGAAQLYRSLHKGVNNSEKNPVFYLSNSPWNMYHYLQSFLDHNGFPKGPILLRSFSTFFQRATDSEKPHKQKEIINLLDAYPDLKFILIGDSGEHDATIYTEIAAQFPHRILCIYLRTVKHKRRMRYVQSVVDNFSSTPVLLVETSDQAAEHARSQGYI